MSALIYINFDNNTWPISQKTTTESALKIDISYICLLIFNTIPGFANTVNNGNSNGIIYRGWHPAIVPLLTGVNAI